MTIKDLIIFLGDYPYDTEVVIANGKDDTARIIDGVTDVEIDGKLYAIIMIDDTTVKVVKS